MATRENTALRPGTPGRPAAAQSRRRVASSPGHRHVRQVEAIDAWNAVRREREQALHAPSLSRDERMDVAREVEALRRTHEAIKARCARMIGPGSGVLGRLGPTAVVAHRHAWLVDKLVLLLGERGVTVLVSTDNAADALGAVVAEQPDIVLVGDRLAMMPVGVLLADVRRFAPDALLAVAASDPQQAGAWRDQVDAVFLKHQSPSVVADALSALCSDDA